MWLRAYTEFCNASFSVMGSHTFSLPYAILQLILFCLKPLLNSTYLSCPIYETTPIMEQEVMGQRLEASIPSRSSALKWARLQFCCMHASKRLATLLHYPFLCFSEKRILAFGSFKEQVGCMLDVVSSPTFNSAF